MTKNSDVERAARHFQENEKRVRAGMINRAMAEKLQRRLAIDVSKCEREGPYYVLKEDAELELDYCDAEKELWIWSIGRRLSDGKILASPGSDLYQNPAFECVWLR